MAEGPVELVLHFHNHGVGFEGVDDQQHNSSPLSIALSLICNCSFTELRRSVHQFVPSFHQCYESIFQNRCNVAIEAHNNNRLCSINNTIITQGLLHQVFQLNKAIFFLPFLKQISLSNQQCIIQILPFITFRKIGFNLTIF